MSKFWYTVETENYTTKYEFVGKSGKAEARRTAKRISANGVEVYVNGYDVAEVWRNGKKS